MDGLLESLLQEEIELLFKGFNEETAWEIGNRLEERAIRDELPITIDITRGAHQLFHAGRPGTSIEVRMQPASLVLFPKPVLGLSDPV